jgi:Alkylmercury lyase/LexA DNA binding domain
MKDVSETDRRVRRQVYDTAMNRGYPPAIAEIASALDLRRQEAEESLSRLAAGRVLVLQPDSGEILMANPFSAVPTPFSVELASFACYGNCIWDALGIPALVRQDARIKTSCGDCGLALALSVVDGRVSGDPSVVHFAIPARHWWDDIVFN